MSKILKNVFTTEEVNNIKDQINHMVMSKSVEMEDQGHFIPEPMVQYSYLNQGRRDTYEIQFPDIIVNKITKIANDFLLDEEPKVKLTSVQYTEYSGNMGGNPSLGIHFDGGKECNMILDYQLDSNISWGIGIDEHVYTLSDNELILLNPVTKIHYRPTRKFDKGEILRMIFFKFGSEYGDFYSPQISEEKMARIQSIYEDYYSEDGK